MPATKREAIANIAALVGADPSAFDSLLDLREEKKNKDAIDIEPTLRNYLIFVDAVTTKVDQQLATK
jgi:hypothetical protein